MFARLVGRAVDADQMVLVAGIGMADYAHLDAEVGELDAGCAVDHDPVPLAAIASSLDDDPGREHAVPGER